MLSEWCFFFHFIVCWVSSSLWEGGEDIVGNEKGRQRSMAATLSGGIEISEGFRMVVSQQLYKGRGRKALST